MATTKIDLGSFTLAEFRSMFDPGGPDIEDLIIGRAAGLTIEEFRAQPYNEYRQLTKAFWAAVSSAGDAEADPND